MQSAKPARLRIFSFILFSLLLAVLCSRPYRHPLFDMDMLGYMGNAVAMTTRNPAEIHRIVYQELRSNVPNPPLDHLLGKDPNSPADQNASRSDRATNMYHFAEYLPCFAIRPLFNEILCLMWKAGLGLVYSTTLIAVTSFFLLGILLYVWNTRYCNPLVAGLVTLLLMLCPPILNLARF